MVFAPTGRIPSFEGWHRGLICGSVAGALIARPEVWSRFKRGRKQQLWYFDELMKVYEDKCPEWRIVQELKRTVKELARISEHGQTA